MDDFEDFCPVLLRLPPVELADKIVDGKDFVGMCTVDDAVDILDRQQEIGPEIYAETQLHLLTSTSVSPLVEELS